ncbi:MAG: hypothetical protein IJ574_01850 [Bacilli bacterium]|nr:hypothetical protein [Bacilli bacterium]
MINKSYENIKHFILDNIKTIIIYGLLIALFFIQTPYVVNTPGGAIDLNKRITVGDNNNINGTLSMAYVKQLKGNIPFVLLSYIIPNWDLVKIEDITYDNESLTELNKINKLQLEEAVDNAILAAFNISDKNYKIKDYELNVMYISDKADTDIELFDKIIEVNDNKVTNLEEIKKIITELNSGEIVNLEVLRNDKKIKATAKTYKEENGETKIGLATITDYDIETDPTVEIKTKSSESGPSGGLMMALSIYDNLNDIDLVKGRNIIGTGTINSDGKVGEIGGVKYKVLGAAKNDADIFLCPKDNYKEATKVVKNNKLKIKVVSVETLSDAIEYLKKTE